MHEAKSPQTHDLCTLLTFTLLLENYETFKDIFAPWRGHKFVVILCRFSRRVLRIYVGYRWKTW